MDLAQQMADDEVTFDQPGLEPKVGPETQEHFPSAQLKFELFMNRLGKGSLIVSIILFVTLMCTSPISGVASAVVTGLAFSMFLFVIWMSINSVYGENKSLIGGMKVTFLEPKLGFD